MDSLAKKIADAIGKYHVGFMQKKVLKTIEEIEATTDPLEKYIAGAGPVDELYNNLISIKGKIWGSDNPHLEQVTLPYVAPENCFMLIDAVNSTGNTTKYYTISSKLLNTRVASSCTYGMYDVRWLPVIKGDTISIVYNTLDSLNFFIVK